MRERLNAFIVQSKETRFSEVKSRGTAKSKYPKNLAGKADQLKKNKYMFQRMVGWTAFSHTYICGFVAFPN